MIINELSDERLRELADQITSPTSTAGFCRMYYANWWVARA
jgi:hypothetical protein